MILYFFSQVSLNFFYRNAVPYIEEKKALHHSLMLKYKLVFLHINIHISRFALFLNNLTTKISFTNYTFLP